MAVYDVMVFYFEGRTYTTSVYKCFAIRGTTTGGLRILHDEELG
jgi:hypothetical protein